MKKTIKTCEWCGEDGLIPSEYSQYHRAVVDEICSRTNESVREFFNSADYSEEHERGDCVDCTAQSNIDSADWEERGEK